MRGGKCKQGKVWVRKRIHKEKYLLLDKLGFKQGVMVPRKSG
jgi:hypothetical protein